MAVANPLPTVNRRALVAIVAVLGLLCLGLGLSIGYPLLVVEEVSVAPGHGPGDLDSPAPYRVHATVASDGERASSLVGVVTADGARYRRLATEDGTVREYYQPAPDDDVYELWRPGNEERTRRLRDRVAAVDGLAILGEERVDGQLRIYVRDTRERGLARRIAWSADGFLDAAGRPEFEFVASTSGERVYEPRGGWFDSDVGYLGKPTPYRITDAEGSLTIDADSGAIRSANVTYRMAEQVPTYLHYLLADEERLHVTYEFGRDPTAQEPAWVERARNLE